ncbi:MAG: hypothetical protein ABIK92_09860, partial [Pseudomonadota bacterium]
VPDYVLYRPNNPSSEKKADKEIKEIVARREASKQKAKNRKAKTTGSVKKTGPESKPRSGRRNDKAGKKPSRSGSRFPQSSKQGKLRGRGKA